MNLALLALVTPARVDVDPNVIDGMTTIYVTTRDAAALPEALQAVGAALENMGATGRRARVRGKTTWRTIIGAVNGCKGYPDGHRGGFVVRA